MDREKVEALVDSLIDCACDKECYMRAYGTDSPHYRGVVKKQNVLKSEIISYLAGEKEDK